MILPIYLYGSAILHEKTESVTADYPDLQQLIDDMYETMHQAEGVGLAAPQIGKSIRLFVIDADPHSDEYPEAKGFKKTFINPTIIETSGESLIYKEGCLSVPDIREDITRNSVVKINYFDEHFDEHTDVYDGIISRIVQHEYDHIEQTVFVDRISQLKKKLLKRKLDNIKQGKNKPIYKTRVN
jgi:peptide deformylase